jgi:hypothetical protein
LLEKNVRKTIGQRGVITTSHAPAAGGKRCRPQGSLNRCTDWIRSTLDQTLIGTIRYSIGRGLPIGNGRLRRAIGPVRTVKPGTAGVANDGNHRTENAPGPFTINYPID